MPGGRITAPLLTRPLQALLLVLVAAGLLLAGSWPASAQELRPVPLLAGRVIDQTLTLDPPQRSALEAQLATIERERGAQIVVLMVPSTLPEDIAAYAQRVADAWRIGRRGVGDGLLIVVAKDDRRIRIEVAKALEGAIPDLAARQIIDSALRPAFRENDYAGGLTRALTLIEARLRGEALPTPDARSARGGGGDRGGGFDLGDLGLFLFVGVPVVAMLVTRIFGRALGSLLVAGGAGGAAWWFSHSLLVAVAVGLVALVVVGILGIGSAARRMLGGHRRSGHPGGWSAGSPGWGGGWSGGGGGGSSDSFSSGGGGDFGGGGASGDW